MKSASAVLSLSLSALLAVACSAQTSTDATGSSEDLLVADNQDAEAQDTSGESSLDEGLSGAEPTDPGAEADPSSDDASLAVKIKTNAGRFFQPAGCLATTELSKGVFQHVFTNCTGPHGRLLNGTVTATWTRPEAASLQVVRVAKAFSIDGATVDRTVTVVYSKDGTSLLKQRTVAMSGTNAAGKAFTRDASWKVSYDPSTKCIERSGSASSTVGQREFSSTVSNYKRCGVGDLGCPESGTITLSRKKGIGGAASDISISIDFSGGKTFTITGPGGRKLVRALVCKA